MGKRILALFLLLSCFLSGCSLNFKDPEDLIKPPKPGGDLAGVQEALQAKVGKNIILKNPKNGEYRSAFIQYDIDNDGSRETIVFYKQNSDMAKLHMNILDKVKEQWVSVADFDDLGSDINELIFQDLNGSGIPEMIVKCDALENKQYNALVYTWSQDGPQPLLNESYTEMALLDMDADSFSELLLLNLDINRGVSKARMLKLGSDDVMDIGSEVLLSPDVTGYVSIKMDKTTRVYIDSYCGPNTMITEILQWQNHRLSALLINGDIDNTQQTKRDIIITSQDIDGDGIIEIPKNIQMVGQNYTDKDALWLTAWNKYIPDNIVVNANNVLTSQQFTTVMTGAINFADSYMFVYPEDWVNDVTVVPDTEQRLWTFYRWDAKNKTQGAKLLGILTTTKTQWEKQPVDGYTRLKEKGTTVYAIQMFDEPSERALTFEQMEENFIIIN